MSSPNSTNGIVSVLQRFPTAVRSLLVSHRETDLFEAVVTPQNLLRLGDRFLRLAGLLVLARVVRRDRTEIPVVFKRYVAELVTRICPYSSGYAAEFINLAPQVGSEPGEKRLLEGFRDITHTWLQIEAKARATKREKELLYLHATIADALCQYAQDFECCFPLEIEFAKNGTRSHGFLIPPVLIVSAPGAAESELTYALDVLDTDADTLIYENWPANEKYPLRLRGTSEEADVVRSLLLKCVAPARGRGAPRAGGAAPETTRDRSTIPLIAHARPAIVKLADLLLQNTGPWTLWKLWGHDYLRSTKGRGPSSQAERQEWVKGHRDDLREQIVLSCLETDPIRVLLTVANEEGRGELIGYIQDLYSEEEAQTILKQAERVAWYNASGPVNRNENPDKVTIFQRTLAVEIARKLGFDVSNESALMGVRFYMTELRRLAALAGSAQSSLADLKSLMIETANLVEHVLKEVYLFYRYLHPDEDTARRGHAEAPTDSSAAPRWLAHLKDVQKWGLGTLVEQCGALLNDRSLQEALRDRIQMRGLDGAKLKNALGGPTKQYFVAARNSIPHDLAEHIAVKSKLADGFRRQDVAAVRECAKVFVGQGMDVLDLLVDEKNGERNRIYPYKTTFTMRAETVHGTTYLVYYTDACDEPRTAETRIYTDEPVALNKVYYCLPHRTRSSQKVWVDPLLLEADLLRLV